VNRLSERIPRSLLQGIFNAVVEVAVGGITTFIRCHFHVRADTLDPCHHLATIFMRNPD